MPMDRLWILLTSARLDKNCGFSYLGKRRRRAGRLPKPLYPAGSVACAHFIDGRVMHEHLWIDLAVALVLVAGVWMVRVWMVRR